MPSLLYIANHLRQSYSTGLILNNFLNCNHDIISWTQYSYSKEDHITEIYDENMCVKNGDTFHDFHSHSLLFPLIHRYGKQSFRIYI